MDQSQRGEFIFPIFPMREFHHLHIAWNFCNYIDVVLWMCRTYKAVDLFILSEQYELVIQ